MQSQDIAKKFLEFFKKRDHAVIQGASLIPKEDPTVLFTTAGMHPLVPFLLGERHPSGKRLANVQKCIRTGDIDEVGDGSHLTFFQMLGNWSLGDYFKKEAIEYSYEFLTKELKLDKNRLAVTCFKGDKDAEKDEEAANIWLGVGITRGRIAFLGKENNWWGPAGETGPCGPDTEMFYYIGNKIPRNFNPKDKNWIEIWNDVFMQYNKRIRTILVDGLGCIYDEDFKINEKLANIINKFNAKKILVVSGSREKGRKASEEYLSDAFSLEEKGVKKDNPEFFRVLLKKYNLKPEEVVYFDHAEANIKSAESLRIKSKIYKDDASVEKFIQDNLYYFEPLKQKNVDTGMGLERMAVIMQSKDNVYDTDLFSGIISKIKALSKKNDIKAIRIIADHLRASTFILAEGVRPSNVEQGYVLRRLIRRSLRYGNKINAEKGFSVEVVKAVINQYSKTYPELKQNEKFILDELEKEEKKFENTLVRGLTVFDKETVNIKGKLVPNKLAFDLYQSYGFPIEMTVELANDRNLKVDEKAFWEEFKKHQEISRKGSEQKFKGGLSDYSIETTKLHTATHLLLQALKEIVDKKIEQKGSNITKERLRLDFNYNGKLTDEQIKKTEDLINKKIKEGLNVEFNEMPLQEAKKLGATGVFEHKYGDRVKVYFIKGFSKEICGGPHVSNTKELGRFKILKEESVAAGIRRIKAVLE